MKFYRCNKCGKIVEVIKGSNAPVGCCNEQMTEIVPGTTDAAVEKHTPVYEVKNNKVYVNVGEIEHPMQDEHYIEWVELITDKGMQRKSLSPKDEAKAVFTIDDDEKVQAVYAYCNLHSLWQK